MFLAVTPPTPDHEFLGFLPSWVGDLLTIVAIAVGLPGVILFLLNRRNANRHLNVEEGTLKVDEFGAIKSGYEGLWQAAQADAAAARADATAARKDADNARQSAEEANSHAAHAEESVRKLHTLIMSIVRRNKLELDEEQLRILEETKPRPLRRSRARK